MQRTCIVCIVLLVVIIQLITPCSGDDTTTTTTTTTATYILTGSGASSTSLLWNILGFVYRSVDPTSQIQYTPSSSGGGVTDINNRIVDFAGSDVMQSQSALDQNKLLQFPIAGMAIALLYNIGTQKQNNLVLSRQTLVDIFSGKINNWSDSQILMTNPSIILPNESITIIYRAGGSGTNQVFTSALSTFDRSFNHSNDPATWPFAVSGRGIVVQESSDIASFVRNIPYSLSYVAHPFASGLPTIALTNQQNQNIVPSAASVRAALMGANQKLQSTYIDINYEGAYPIVTLTFMLYHKDTQKDCLFTLGLAEMLYWTTSGEVALEAGAYQNYVPAQSLLSYDFTQDLTTIMCNGAYAYNYLFSFEEALLSIGLVSALLCIIMVAVIAYTRIAYITRPWEIMVTLVGQAASFTSVYLWIGYPVDWMCKSRPWITFLCFSSVAWQLKEAIGAAIDDKKFRNKFGAHPEYKISATLFAVNLVLVCLWMTISPPTEVHRRCMGDNQTAFTLILVAYNVFLILFGYFITLYAIHKQRATSAGEKTSLKTILIAIFMGCLYLPVNLLGIRSNYDFLGQLLSPATGTIIYSALVVGVVIIPELKPTWKALASQRSSKKIQHLSSLNPKFKLESDSFEVESI